MRTTVIGGKEVAALGMGTWNMGDIPQQRDAEIESLRTGLDLGLNVIDTAEMYGSGRSEILVGEAIADRRDEVFLVSKVLPHRASFHGVQQACHESLKRLKTNRLDLYLLHWPGSVPLEETLQGFEKLQAEGLIGAWGLSNFDVSDMSVPTPLMQGCAANQILYSLEYRGVEFDLLDYNANNAITSMAYSPLGQGGAMLRAPVLATIAKKHKTKEGKPATPAQIALAWVLRDPSVLPIPKAGTAAHIRDNFAAASIKLSDDDLNLLDKHFKPPMRKQPLSIL